MRLAFKLWLQIMCGAVYLLFFMFLLMTSAGMWLGHVRDSYWWEYVLTVAQFLVGLGGLVADVIYIGSRR